MIAAAVAVCALLCTLPGRALASGSQSSILMDDDELIYSSPAHVAKRLSEVKALGVDQVKVSMVWSLVAPDAGSTHKPKFDATNPRAYPAGAWDRYDTLVREATALGMTVYFQLSPLSPRWALPREANQGPILGRAPTPGLFRQFVQAVGTRYSGSFTADIPASEPPSSLLGLPVSLTPTQQQATQPGSPVPRVSTWSIWNEPNERSWLNPWYRKVGRRGKVLLQPSLYRGLVDAGWSALKASGHTGDTILIGETANKGIMEPMPFIRAVYCVGTNLQPLRGSAASAVACPTSGSRAGFVNAHPGLFYSTGYAHHPYVFETPPTTRAPDNNTIALSNLPVFERAIDRVFANYGVRRPGGVPLYLTEWGFKTNPPNPYVKTTLSQQATWLNQGEYMTWLDPRVHALAQFELVDSPPKPRERKGSKMYWSTFQTGLLFRNGAAKPSFASFRLPIWLPVARHGARVTVWGQLRPADHTTTQQGAIQFRRRGQSTWSTLRIVQTSSPEGFIVAHVPIPAAGSVRLAWRGAAAGTTDFSRTVTVS